MNLYKTKTMDLINLDKVDHMTIIPINNTERCSIEAYFSEENSYPVFFGTIEECQREINRIYSKYTQDK